MSRPIPLEVIPSHVHLTEEDHRALFGAGYAGTVEHALSQHGQFVYQESVEVKGKLKRSISLRILGPYRKQTQVEITPHEAALLGITAPVARSGDLREAAKCTLKGPAGEIVVQAAIVPQPHLHLSDTDAKTLRIKNGDVVSMEIIGEKARSVDNVIARVHPSYSLRLHIHPDLAREGWLVGQLHARIRESQN